ncbi:Eco57I restriction-modification methylase domain-containing protein [Limosilactobacillus mucosae]
MESNFQFLVKDPDTQVLFDTAKDIEDLYATGKFSNELESIRKVVEYVARQLLDLNYVAMDDRSTFNDCLSEIRIKGLAPNDILQDFYDLKGAGNSAAHTLQKYSKHEALDALKKMYDILVWFGGLYMDEEPDSEFIEPKESNPFKTTAERKVIYVQTGEWDQYKGAEKVGETTTDDLEINSRPNSDDLRNVANQRVKQYMKTSGIPFTVQWAELAYRKKDHSWFHDYDVHDVLERSGVKKSKKLEGNEWFNTDVETVKQAIKAVKEGRKSINAPLKLDIGKIKLRPEQKEAIAKTKKAFKRYDKMLWNAKMRFGKTLSALQLIKEEKYQHVLIMTHRPVVDEGWFEDFRKIGMPDAGYLYGSKKTGEDISYLLKSDKPYVYFASLQDLRGSEEVGGKQGDKNHEIFDNEWDLVIVDEAHEGTQTDLAQKVTDEVVTEGHTKLLELSGTPFNILDQYDEDQVYTWDYVMEQQAKLNWSIDHPNEPNPYEGLPKVSMYTFEMSRNFKEAQFMNEDKQSFNFKEFFRVDDQGKFVYESKVKQFLRNITTPDSRTNYPFSTAEFRNSLRHTLWILPGVKEANALEDLMKQDPVFGMDYKIVNVVRNGDDNGVASESDIDKVNAAMKPDPATTKTITLTVRKMTTGVTIKPWTGVVFLSNTNSAMQYLQAAFRAQTPYSSPTFGEKTNCYIFDFAPDRALTVMAETSQLNTGVGKRTTGAQKDKMAQLLNFLPIIGETGQSMKPFKVDSLLAKIKRVYAEKAVRTGFDDDSLYSDELLMLDNVDLQDFNKLKEIVGTTKSEKKEMEVNVNDQGLTDEEYDTANRAKKKPKKERTPEEIAALEKMRELKKQRKTMISILRSISIRIPMMIYGMDIDINEDVDIRKFIDLVDSLSWKEFMPQKVTKELFKKFIKYYDPDVFIEAGRIIRRKTKELDKLDPMERAEKLALIFGTFRNPDKETVLTPWRVVNMHLGKTLGGFNFYDEDYQYTTKDGKGIRDWRETEYTNRIFNPNSHILEINSKTGLYPLYAALSIYYREYMILISQSGGKFSLEDQRMIWQRVLRENIFVVAKTPMAKEITQRTLSGYLDMDTNIVFVDRIVEDAKENPKLEAKKIKGLFGNMKFDVVIGNPPYQESDNDSGKGSAKPIYQYFVGLAKLLHPDLITLITPSVWFIGGKGLDGYRSEMLNDKCLEQIYNFETPKDVFPSANLRGGVSFFLLNKDYDNSKEGLYVETIRDGKVTEKGKRPITIPGIDIFISSNKSYEILNKLYQNGVIKTTGSKNMFESFVSPRNPFGLATSFRKDKRFKDSKSGLRHPVKVFAKGGLIGYTEKDNIKKNVDWIDKIKVLTPFANNVGTDLNDDNINTIIADMNTVATETYLVIGANESLSLVEAKNITRYLKTKFCRFLISLAKANQNGTRQTYRFVPNQDFTKHSDIDWTKLIPEIDQQLYKKYGLSDEEIKFIETKVQAMD